VKYIQYFTLTRIWQKRFSRWLHWLIKSNRYRLTIRDEKLLYRCARHSSKLMRDHLDDPRYMQWQVNKVKNLKRAIPHINNVIIPPGKSFHSVN